MKAQAGAVAQQQALVLVFGLSYRQAAAVAGIHHRNLWSHVVAKSGSNVAPWESRSIEIKREAIKKAIRLFLEKNVTTARINYKLDFIFDDDHYDQDRIEVSLSDTTDFYEEESDSRDLAYALDSAFAKMGIQGGEWDNTGCIFFLNKVK